MNLSADCDIHADFTQLDEFCADGRVQEFFMSHALEHVPSQQYRKFLDDVLRKLRPGGELRIIQTDIRRCLEMFQRGELSFRVLRTVVFTPADRLAQNPLNHHFNMWGAEDLAEDFLATGFAEVEFFDAGTWPYDMTDELFPGHAEAFHGVPIPNLGVVGRKASGPVAQGAEIGRQPGSSVYCSDVLRGGIPKIIHQTWKTCEIPPPFKEEWCDSWRRMNPGWDYRFWTDEDLREFVVVSVPDFLKTYDDYDTPIKRVDAARYLILQKLGGVFVDLDFICLRPISSLLETRSLVFGSQHADIAAHPGDWICNAFMASAPGHPVWNDIGIDLADCRDEGPVAAGGPAFLTQRCAAAARFLAPESHPYIVPAAMLYPLAWDDPRRMNVREIPLEQMRKAFPSATALTVWTANWIADGAATKPCHLTPPPGSDGHP